MASAKSLRRLTRILADNIREHRLSQEDLAEQYGLHRTYELICQFFEGNEPFEPTNSFSIVDCPSTTFMWRFKSCSI